MSAWHRPAKIYPLSHKLAQSVLLRPLFAEEKIDGSFIAFGDFPINDAGEIVELGTETDYELKVRSKGAVIYPNAPPTMFKPAVATITGLTEELKKGWLYQGESLHKPKASSLAYERVPKGNVIIHDILRGQEDYLTYEEMYEECQRLGLECVSKLYEGTLLNGPDQLRAFLKKISILGGQEIEGMVLKPQPGHEVYDLDGRQIRVKFVGERFKEVHRSNWKADNPTQKDVVERIVQDYATPARWNKAIVRLAEQDKLTATVRDIGPLIVEIQTDTFEECEEDMKERLWKHVRDDVRRKLARGFPEWYKERLLEQEVEDAVVT